MPQSRKHTKLPCSLNRNHGLFGAEDYLVVKKEENYQKFTARHTAKIPHVVLEYMPANRPTGMREGGKQMTAAGRQQRCGKFTCSTLKNAYTYTASQ